jgi:hypothetical protein
MKIFTRTAEYAPFNHKRNEEISEEFRVEPADEKLRRSKPNCLRHVTRMDNNMMTEIMLNFGPNGRRGAGRTLKRLFDETETVSQGLTRDG